MPVPYFLDEFVNQAAHDYSVPWNIFDAIDPVLPSEIEFLAEAYDRVARQYGISDTGFAVARKKI